jgi:hypothetical protein
LIRLFRYAPAHDFIAVDLSAAHYLQFGKYRHIERCALTTEYNPVNGHREKRSPQHCGEHQPALSGGTLQGPLPRADPTERGHRRDRS